MAGHIEQIYFFTALPFAIWAAWKDLSLMKLPNKMNVAIAVTVILLGLIFLPLEDIGMRTGIAVLAFVALIILATLTNIGGGDAKYLAATFPSIAVDDLSLFLVTLTMSLVVAFGIHRTCRSVKWIRSMTADWKSWTSVKFPFGFAISGAWLLILGTRAFNLPSAIG